MKILVAFIILSFTISAFSCSKNAEGAASLFVKEESIAKDKASVTEQGTAKFQVFKVVNTDSCGAYGCDISLFTYDNKKCLINSLTESRARIETVEKDWSKIKVLVKSDAIDGGRTAESFYAYNSKNNQYEKVKK